MLLVVVELWSGVALSVEQSSVIGSVAVALAAFWIPFAAFTARPLL